MDRRSKSFNHGFGSLSMPEKKLLLVPVLFCLPPDVCFKITLQGAHDMYGRLQKNAMEMYMSDG